MSFKAFISSALALLCASSTSFSSSFVAAAIPQLDFAGLFANLSQPSSNWCTTCVPFRTPPSCVMGCAGDPGGGACPATACPSVYTFSQSVWNIDIHKASGQSGPYRAFTYIPICTGAAGNTCTEPFVFSFSVKLGTDASTTVPTTGPLFDRAWDYWKLMFWSDGNNILAVKKGQLLGVPSDGVGDLVNTNTVSASSFMAPFAANTWYDISVTMDVRTSENKVYCSFKVNGQTPAGHQTATVGIGEVAGLQFGAYVWTSDSDSPKNYFKLQYKNIQITPVGAAVTTIPPPTTDPSATTAPPSTVTTSTPATGGATTPAPTPAGTGTVSAAAAFPTSIPNTGSFTVPISYTWSSTAGVSAVINVDILSNGDNSWYGKGFATVTAAATATTAQVTLTIQSTLPATKTYYLHGFITDSTTYNADPSVAYMYAAGQTPNIAVTVNGAVTSSPSSTTSTPNTQPGPTGTAPGSSTTSAVATPTPTMTANGAPMTTTSAAAVALLATVLVNMLMAVLLR